MYKIVDLLSKKTLKGIVFNSDILSIDFDSSDKDDLLFNSFNRAWIFVKFICDVRKDVVYHYDIIKVRDY